MTRLPLAALLAGSFALAGCGAIPVPTTVETPGMPNPEQALRNSMQHVDAEMGQLGSLSPAARRLAGPVPTEDLQRIISFSWNGALDQGVAKLAQSIGYTFYTTGPSNQQPVPVAIEIGSVPIYQVFQMLGDQAGTLATVQVDPVHHQVQVIHHG
jgi:defect in organelle trafficking protein DotD